MNKTACLNRIRYKSISPIGNHTPMGNTEIYYLLFVDNQVIKAQDNEDAEYIDKKIRISKTGFKRKYS
jgi:hypothetical protein